MHEVFISYSSKDKQWADAACAVLERQRIRCWIAPRDITPGTEWGEAITNGIDAGKIMVLIFSTNANESPQVRREVELAISKGMAVLPFRLENVTPSGAMKFALSNTHWLDAFSAPVERRAKILAESVHTLLKKQRESSDVDSKEGLEIPSEGEGSTKEPLSSLKAAFVRRRRVVAMVAGGLLMACLVVFGISRIYRSNAEFAKTQVNPLDPVLATAPSDPKSASTLGPPPDVKEGFAPMFNRKDLSGWMVEGDEGKGWSVADGEIIAWGQNFKTRNYLLTEREYGDFLLRLEFNLSQDSVTSVALRAMRGEKLPWDNNGSNSSHPALGLIENRSGTYETGTLFWVTNANSLAPSQSAEMLPAGTWNRLEIELKNRSIRAWVNDKQIVSQTLAGGSRLSDGCIPALNRPRGRIGLLKHTGTVRFRNIGVKELPGESDLAAKPKEGKGYAADILERDRGKWRVVENCLEQTSLTENVVIGFGDKNWSDYDFSVDFLRIKGNDQCCLAFLCDPETRGCLFGLSSWLNTAHTVEGVIIGKPMRLYVQKKGSLPSGTWQNARVSVRGNHAQCFLNGEKLFECQIDMQPTGRVGLRTWNSIYRFRNIKVTDPKGKVLLEGLPELDSSWSAK